MDLAAGRFFFFRGGTWVGCHELRSRLWVRGSPTRTPYYSRAASPSALSSSVSKTSTTAEPRRGVRAVADDAAAMLLAAVWRPRGVRGPRALRGVLAGDDDP